MSLRARVLAGMAIVALVLAVTAVVVTRATERYLVDQVDEQLRAALGPALRSELTQGRGRPNGNGLPRAQAGDQRLSSLYLGVVQADGTVIALSTPDISDEAPPLPELDGEEALARADSGEAFTVGSVGSDVRQRVTATSLERSEGAVVLALPLTDVDAAVDRLVAFEVAATAAILAVLGLVSWWVVHLGVRPVKRMTVAAGAIAAGDLSQRVPEAAPGTEAGQLGVALNQMLGRIDAAFDERGRSEARLRRFVADASHELRTPVATIRGYAELYRAGGLDRGDRLDDAMRRTEQEAVRMGTLVDDLLHLARLDQGRPLGQAPVDLAAISVDAVNDARAVDPARPVTVRTDGPVTVTGDDGRLRQVVANLVGNAVDHTPPGTPIEVRVGRSDDRAVLEVRDEGPGMSAEVAARAFERFYRADPSRSRHRGGSGLGLAIVQATVTAHGGQVSLETAEGAGTTVRVELPLHETSQAAHSQR